MNEKDKVYFKLQTIIEAISENEFSGDENDYGPNDYILTGWYKTGAMIDESLIEKFPDLEDAFGAYDIDDVTEGTLIIYVSSSVTTEDIVEQLRLAGFNDIRYSAEEEEIEDLDN